jgi:hypothetical protein
MAVYNFGAGTIIGRRTDIANPTPAFMGVMQDIDVEFNQALKELVGQYKVAVDVAPALLKITAKAKFARIQSTMINDLILGQTIVPATGRQMAVAEVNVIATTVTVAHAATFSQDLGVFYTTTGVQFQRVASAPAVGQYSVNEVTGVYTFNSGTDVGKSATFYYEWTVTVGFTEITMANQLMGTGPSFELHIQETYTNNAGVANTMHMKFNACRSGKLNFPMKNVDYTVQDVDIQMFADTANNIGILTFVE